MKLAHTRSMKGRRGGKLFHNGPTYSMGPATFGNGTYDSRGRHDRRPGAVGVCHGHAMTGRPGWANAR